MPCSLCPTHQLRELNDAIRRSDLDPYPLESALWNASSIWIRVKEPDPDPEGKNSLKKILSIYYELKFARVYINASFSKNRSKDIKLYADGENNIFFSDSGSGFVRIIIMRGLIDRDVRVPTVKMLSGGGGR